MRKRWKKKLPPDPQTKTSDLKDRIHEAHAFMEREGLMELSVQDKDSLLHITRRSRTTPPPSTRTAGKRAGRPQATDNLQSEMEESGWVAVPSPLVGMLYRAPQPQSEPFVTLGELIQKGQTLCIIEAMKMMNEIPSPISGRVAKILAEDGAAVTAGQTLFFIDPS